MQHFLQLINGVTHTKVGFANGNTDNPTYKEVYTDTTGYAETVYVEYDPEQVSLTSDSTIFQGNRPIKPQQAGRG